MIIVTSNYDIPDFCDGDIELKNSIERRFIKMKAIRHLENHDCTFMLPNGMEHYLTEDGKFEKYEPNINQPWMKSIPLTLAPSTVSVVSAS